MALQCKVAWELLVEEPEEVHERIQKECDEAHVEDMAIYRESGEGLPSVDPEIQQERCENFMAIMALLLNGLQLYTGYTINLITGRMDGTDFNVHSTNTGLVKGMDWAQWDPTSYRVTLKMYANFVHQVHIQSDPSVEATSSAGTVTSSAALPTAARALEAEPPAPKDDSDVDMPLAISRVVPTLTPAAVLDVPSNTNTPTPPPPTSVNVPPTTTTTMTTTPTSMEVALPPAS
ncbi:hypothetical protein B0H19DRAFT_1247504 [Mycena capillaripes]|nr:hypothetical protein B0H19DRAFT_1247504 [Mycena capillaripes]